LKVPLHLPSSLLENNFNHSTFMMVNPAADSCNQAAHLHHKNQLAHVLQHLNIIWLDPGTGCVILTKSPPSLPGPVPPAQSLTSTTPAAARQQIMEHVTACACVT
jgi:hypothetical protein